METDEEIKKDENDIAEDEREENEELSKDDSNKNDVSEDAREEAESVDSLKEVITKLTIENESLKKEVEKLTTERDEAHKMFLGTDRESEPERTSQSILNDIK